MTRNTIWEPSGERRGCWMVITGAVVGDGLTFAVFDSCPKTAGAMKETIATAVTRNNWPRSTSKTASERPDSYSWASGSTVDSLITVTTIEEFTDCTFGIFDR